MQTNCPFCESTNTRFHETRKELKTCSHCTNEWEGDDPLCARCEQVYKGTRTQISQWRTCSDCEVEWRGSLPTPDPSLPMTITATPKPAELNERIPPSPAIMAKRAEQAMQKAESGTTQFYCAENGRDYLQKFHRTGSPRHLFLSHVFLTLAEGSEDLQEEHYLVVCDITQNPGTWLNAPPEVHAA